VDLLRAQTERWFAMLAAEAASLRQENAELRAGLAGTPSYLTRSESLHSVYTNRPRPHTPPGSPPGSIGSGELYRRDASDGEAGDGVDIAALAQWEASCGCAHAMAEEGAAASCRLAAASCASSMAALTHLLQLRWELGTEAEAEAGDADPASCERSERAPSPAPSAAASDVAAAEDVPAAEAEEEEEDTLELLSSLRALGACESRCPGCILIPSYRPRSRPLRRAGFRGRLQGAPARGRAAAAVRRE